MGSSVQLCASLATYFKMSRYMVIVRKNSAVAEKFIVIMA